MFFIRNTIVDFAFLFAGLKKIIDACLEYLGAEWVRVTFYLLLKFFVVLKIIEYKSSIRSKNLVLDERTHQIVHEKNGIFSKSHTVGNLEAFSNKDVYHDTIIQDNSVPPLDDSTKNSNSNNIDSGGEIIIQGNSVPTLDNMLGDPKQSHLHPSELYIFNNIDCKPENCPSTFSSSCGCIKLPNDKKKLLNTRGNNSRTQKCSKGNSRDIYENFENNSITTDGSTVCNCKYYSSSSSSIPLPPHLMNLMKIFVTRKAVRPICCLQTQKIV